MFQARFGSLFKRAAIWAGLLPWWEARITPWPRVIFYHYVGSDSPRFMCDTALGKEIFVAQIAALRKRYRFLTWPEYKDSLASPREAKRSILLTFDDAFRSSWAAVEQIADDHDIPSVFFVNTRVLNNAYTPWTIQYYFLRSQANSKFLKPLWNSISEGVPLPPEAARKRCHQRFSLREVVQPIEEGLAKFGMTPAELAAQYQLYVSTGDISKRHDLIEIGNHSHSHYILSKLDDAQLDEDLRSSHEILKTVLGQTPETFAYPFGIPEAHFDERCLRSLRSISPYPYIFSATDDPSLTVKLNEKNRACMDNISTPDAVGTVAKVTPRTLQNWLLH